MDYAYKKYFKKKGENMKNNSFLTMFLMGVLSTSSVYADTCEPTDSRWDSSMTPHECATVATGLASATGSGIYSAKKYSEAKLYEEKHTKLVFDDAGKRAVMNSMDGQRLVNQMTDGGKIVFIYELNEIQNREYHINLMESNADSARSSASHARMMSLTAMKTVTTSNGKTTTTTVVPDYAARAMYAMQAASYDQQAIDYDRKAEAARRGGAVPMYSHEKIIDADSGTKNLAQDFIDERAKNTSKITKITRLPVNHFKALKGIINKGRAGLVGLGAGLLFAGEEFMSGVVAEELEENDIPFEIDLSDGND